MAYGHAKPVKILIRHLSVEILPRSLILLTPAPPINLLLLCDYRFDVLNELKVSSVIVQFWISADAVRVEPPLPFHAFGGIAMGDSGLVVADNPLPAFRQSNQCAKSSGYWRYPSRWRENLKERGGCSRSD